jgi:hypothetical protein
MRRGCVLWACIYVLGQAGAFIYPRYAPMRSWEGTHIIHGLKQGPRVFYRSFRCDPHTSPVRPVSRRLAQVVDPVDSSSLLGKAALERDEQGRLVLKALSLKELEHFMCEIGETEESARRLWRWMYSKVRLVAALCTSTSPIRLRSARALVLCRDPLYQAGTRRWVAKSRLQTRFRSTYANALTCKRYNCSVADCRQAGP